MGLVNRTPAVCSVLEGTKFQRMASLELADRDGPAPSTTTTYLYRQLRPIAATPSEIGEPTGQRMRQPVLRTISARRTDVSAGPIALPEADLCFVSCAAKKLARPAAAKDLYMSPWFVKARRLVEAQGWPWFILSAKYGLVAPEEEVAHYEKTLNDMGVAERRDWARKCWRPLSLIWQECSPSFSSQGKTTGSSWHLSCAAAESTYMCPCKDWASASSCVGSAEPPREQAAALGSNSPYRPLLRPTPAVSGWPRFSPACRLQRPHGLAAARRVLLLRAGRITRPVRYWRSRGAHRYARTNGRFPFHPMAAAFAASR